MLYQHTSINRTECGNATEEVYLPQQNHTTYVRYSYRCPYGTISNQEARSIQDCFPLLETFPLARINVLNISSANFEFQQANKSIFTLNPMEVLHFSFDNHFINESKLNDIDILSHLKNYSFHIDVTTEEHIQNRVEWSEDILNNFDNTGLFSFSMSSFK